jgi:inosine-uridine nucleoside N-ribohydrolase
MRVFAHIEISTDAGVDDALAFLQSAFQPSIRDVTAASVTHGAVTGCVVLSTEHVLAADALVLHTNATDSRLWSAWVEQECTRGRCRVVGKPDVRA